MTRETTVLEVGGLHWATSEPVIVKTLLDRPGVLAVEASAVSLTATVTYDRDKTSVAQLLGWVNDCGYHRTEQSAPRRMCHPMAKPAPTAAHAWHGGGRMKVKRRRRATTTPFSVPMGRPVRDEG